MLKYALLGYLSLHPFTGYELKQLMDESANNIWHAKQSQIYTTLKKMENEKLVSSEIVPQTERPDRKVYNISKTGKEELENWVKNPATTLLPIKDEMLLKYFFSMHLENKNDIITQLRISKNLKVQLQADQKSGCTHLTHTLFKDESSTCLDEDAKRKTFLLWQSLEELCKMLTDSYVEWIEKTIKIIDEEFENVAYIPSIE